MKEGLDSDGVLFALLMFAGSVVAVAVHSIQWLVGASVVAYFILLSSSLKEIRCIGRFGGRANIVTLSRYFLLSLALLAYEFLDPYIFGSVAICLAILDGIDGYLARKYGEESRIGARLDVECDAYFVAALSILAWKDFGAGGFVLLAGVMRYISVFVLKLLGWGKVELPPMQIARILAVVYFVVLLTPYFIDLNLSGWGMRIGAIGILCSFGIEYYERYRAIKN